jgi:alkyl sulfatase BDS1-like metallo-beta-lactamase superfamily hydrolase
MGALRDRSEALLDGSFRIEDEPPLQPMFAGEEVARGVYFVSSFANVTAFQTGEGLVLVDTGSFLMAEGARMLLRKAFTAPAHTAIWTHGHVDHCFGVDLYEAEPGGRHVHVVAHEATLERFSRYRLTRGYNACINGRQFQLPPTFPEHFRDPDQLYRDALDVEVGGRRFELRHARGETDDHTWVWVPDERVLCTGDLFIWASPNCGNPQKVQRYPREWAAALRAMSGLGAEVLCPGHGVPIFGADRVQRALVETAELLESLVEQTLRLMNEGARLDRVLAEVRAPEHLLARPYLRPIYDEPEFVVRNLWRLYGGWWDGNPARLKPGSDAARAREIAALAGGADRLASRALELSRAGDHALACHLVEDAWLAAPDDASVCEARARVYEARAGEETSLMAKGIYTFAAHEKK